MGVNQAIDITAEERRIVLALLKRHLPRTVVWVYGSRVKSTSRQQSDLDMVVFTTPEQNGRVGALREAFEESNLPFRVDLFVWDAIPEAFRQRIEAEHVVLIGGNEQRQTKKWSSVQLDDVADLLAGFPFKSKKYVDDRSSPRLLRGDNIAQGTLRWDNAKRWPREETQSLVPYWLRRGDVVIAMDRPWIEAGLKFSAIREADLPALLVQRVARLRGNSRLYTRFLSYVIGGRDFTNYVLSVQTGTAVPHISARQIKEFEFLLPPLHEQRAIAHILGALDDKIELNRRMNETLEEMAQALFESWFVDFDPVRAKMEGRDPGLPQPVADLFPDRLVDSELGGIPKGFRVVPLPEVMEINPRRYLRRGERAPYLPMADMPTKGHAPDTVADRPYGSGKRFTNGDTLVARITPCLENGKTAYVDFLQNDQIGWGSTEYIVMRSRSPLPNEFAYCLARSNGFREFAIQNMSGTSGRQRVPPKAFSALLITAPPKSVAESFGIYIQPLLARVRKGVCESRALASLRNALLPKLISGDLRVNAADHISADTN